jgi:hypothetical protein
LRPLRENADRSIRDNFEPDSNETNVRDLHLEKDGAQIAVTEDEIQARTIQALRESPERE